MTRNFKETHKKTKKKTKKQYTKSHQTQKNQYPLAPMTTWADGPKKIDAK